MEIVKYETRNLRLTLPGLDLALNLYNQLKDMGHGLKGTQALMIALERLNRITFEPQLQKKAEASK
jgi:3-hydroxyisobutyrate dehydrogenase-like beta-hydroxyacid dehydrogenase